MDSPYNSKAMFQFCLDTKLESPYSSYIETDFSGNMESSNYFYRPRQAI